MYDVGGLQVSFFPVTIDSVLEGCISAPRCPPGGDPLRTFFIFRQLSLTLNLKDPYLELVHVRILRAGLERPNEPTACF